MLLHDLKPDQIVKAIETRLAELREDLRARTAGR